LGTRKKILIVDDDAHIRRLLQIKLKKQGYDLILAKDGVEGLNLINNQQPDVVVTDINMPRLDGKSLCEQTNVLKKERPFLTIVLTARISPDEQAWVSQMIDTEFMEKPFSPTMVLGRIDRYLHKT